MRFIRWDSIHEFVVRFFLFLFPIPFIFLRLRLKKPKPKHGNDSQEKKKSNQILNIYWEFCVLQRSSAIHFENILLLESIMVLVRGWGRSDSHVQAAPVSAGYI